MAKNKRGSWRVVLAVVLLLVGLALLLATPVSNHAIKQNQNQALTGLTVKKIKENQKKKGQFDFSKVKSMDPAKAIQARMNNNALVIGAMAIPAVKMYLPVCKGLSDQSMSTGGATMRADQVMGQGNYPLAGHYMTAKGILFSPLENVQTGQKVYLTDLNHVYVYQIYYKKKVSPYNVWLVNNTPQNIVTLITCADGGTNRWAVRGNLVQTQPANEQNLKVFKLQ
jgi:sortase A